MSESSARTVAAHLFNERAQAAEVDVGTAESSRMRRLCVGVTAACSVHGRRAVRSIDSGDAVAQLCAHCGSAAGGHCQRLHAEPPCRG